MMEGVNKEATEDGVEISLQQPAAQLQPSMDSSPPRQPGWSSAPSSPALGPRSTRVNNKHHPGSPNIRQQRPLSTYTALGSPIRNNVGGGGGRMRSMSMGSTSSSTVQPYASRSVPASPNSYGIGNPQASGMGGLLIPNAPPLFGVSTTTTTPPELSATKKAMEAASAAERVRAKTLAEAEVELTADELRAVLKKERLRTGKIQVDLAALRCGTAQQQLAAEVLEEGRINGLMRRLDVLQEEKGRIIVELEREEEMLTNTLQKKLDGVRQEKALLEQQIKKEQNANLVLQNRLGRSTLVASAAEALEEEDEMEEED